MVTLAIQVMTSIAMQSVPVMAPAIAKSMDVSPTLIGTYISIVYGGSLLSSVFAGILVRRYGAIRVSQLGLLFCAIGMLLLSIASTLVLAAVGGFVVGMGVGPITPSSSHLLAKSTPAHQMALIFSIKQSGAPLGGALAGLTLPVLVLGWSIDVAFLAIATSCVACILVAQPLRRTFDDDRHSDHSPSVINLLGPIRMVAADPAIAQLTAIAVIFSVIQACLTTYLVTYLHSTLDFSLAAAGATLSTAQVGGVVGRVAWGYIADRWLSAHRMLALLAMVMSICCIATALLNSNIQMSLILGLMITFGASATGWNGIFLAEVARIAPEGHASEVTGGALSFVFLGIVIGPTLFGVLSGACNSYRFGYAALAMLAAYCAWKMMPTVPTT